MDMSATPRFFRAMTIYIDGVGSVIVDSTNQEVVRFAQAGKKPSPRYATVVVQWPTVSGTINLDKAAAAKGNGQVLTWAFSEQLFEKLKKKHQLSPLSRRDLLVVGVKNKNPQFKGLTPELETDEGATLLRFKESEKAREVYNAYLGRIRMAAEEASASLGRHLTVSQVQEILDKKRAAGGGNAWNGGGGNTGSTPSGGGASAPVDQSLEDFLGE
jgi:hypothetical protein